MHAECFRASDATLKPTAAQQFCLFTGSVPEGNSQHQYVREDSVSLSDSAKDPSGDSDYMQARHQSLDDDYSDDTTSARGRCAHK